MLEDITDPRDTPGPTFAGGGAGGGGAGDAGRWGQLPGAGISPGRPAPGMAVPAGCPLESGRLVLFSSMTHRTERQDAVVLGQITDPEGTTDSASHLEA